MRKRVMLKPNQTQAAPVDLVRKRYEMVLRSVIDLLLHAVMSIKNLKSQKRNIKKKSAKKRRNVIGVEDQEIAPMIALVMRLGKCRRRMSLLRLLWLLCLRKSQARVQLESGNAILMPRLNSSISGKVLDHNLLKMNPKMKPRWSPPPERVHQSHQRAKQKKITQIQNGNLLKLNPPKGQLPRNGILLEESLIK